MADALREALSAALAGFADSEPSSDPAMTLLGALGYRSERILELGSVRELRDELEEAQPLSPGDRLLFETWTAVRIGFQVTDDDIGDTPALFNRFEPGRIESFLFLAVELDTREDRRYTRTQLAEMTRAVNRRYAMPVIMLFHHGTSVTVAAVRRRVHRRDRERDVLEKVTLIKEIGTSNPHRGSPRHPC